MVDLRFEDVRTGDKITVEGPGYTISGAAVASEGGLVVLISGTRMAFTKAPNYWVERSLHNKITLTSHTPAEPAWHRAKVIKAFDFVNGMASGGMYCVASGMDEDGVRWFRDAQGTEWSVGELSGPDGDRDATIIVDEHGKVLNSANSDS